MTQQNWRATVSFASAPTEISDDQADALRAHLPGYMIVHHDGRRIHLSMTVQASTLRQAETEAHKAARAAYTAAFDVVGDAVGIRIVTEEDHQRELAHPEGLDLVGVTDIAQMLGRDGKPMSQQHASQVVAREDFPAPVASPGGRKVWTRKSVEAFAARWPRVKGWAGKPAAAAGT